jgi:hypothetical protein
MLDNFLTQGYVIENDKDVFKFISLDNINWTDDEKIGLQICKKEELIENQLLDTQKYLGEKYVKLIDKNYKLSDKIDLVNGVDKATMLWHNDLIEGPNCGCLLYFDDTDEDTGGAIKFRHAKSKDQICEIYPKKYDIIVINHSLRFQHIVTEQKMPVPRRVMSLNFYLDERLSK